MSGFTCGVWPARRGRGLIAVVVDEDGRQTHPPVTVNRSPQSAWDFLAGLDASVGLDCELVLPDWLARAYDVGRIALQRGGVVWLVPATLLEAVRIVAHLSTGPPARTAAALARLPLASALRAQLRRLMPPPPHQMPLL